MIIENDAKRAVFFSFSIFRKVNEECFELIDTALYAQHT